MKWCPTLMKNRRLIGQAGEDQALQYLLAHGLTLIESNFRRPFGEIDLIMQERTTLVFVEVRSRAAGRFGGAAVSVTSSKQRRLVLAAQAYLQRYADPPLCRFDVIAIDAGNVSWLKNVISG